MRRPPAGSGGHRCQAGSQGTGALINRPSSDQEPLDWLIGRAPLVLVRLVAAEQVEPANTGSQGAGDVGVDHEDAG
jgi:hypothetical protein